MHRLALHLQVSEYFHGRYVAERRSAQGERVARTAGQLDPDRLVLGVLVDGIDAVLATDPRQAVAAERDARGDDAVGVDPDRAGAQRWAATRCARCTSLVQTAPARPYGVSLASATASSSSVNVSAASTGPKTSSRTIGESRADAREHASA